MSPGGDKFGGNVGTTYATLGATFSQVIGHSFNRRVLILPASGSGDIIYSWDPSAPAVVGMIVPKNSQAVQLTRATNGALVNGPVYAAATVGTPVVAVIEEVGV
jgi:hypothetical protein